MELQLRTDLERHKQLWVEGQYLWSQGEGEIRQVRISIEELADKVKRKEQECTEAKEELVAEKAALRERTNERTRLQASLEVVTAQMLQQKVQALGAAAHCHCPASSHANHGRAGAVLPRGADPRA